MNFLFSFQQFFVDHAKLQGCNSDSDTKSISIHLASFDLPCSSFKDSYSRPYLVNTYILSIEVSLCHGLICRSERLVSGVLGSMYALYIYHMQYMHFFCTYTPQVESVDSARQWQGRTTPLQTLVVDVSFSIGKLMRRGQRSLLSLSQPLQFLESFGDSIFDRPNRVLIFNTS